MKEKNKKLCDCLLPRGNINKEEYEYKKAEVLLHEES